MAAGDVVVLDIGAEVAGYSADMTRTLPVSGSFTQEQRALYDLVYKAQESIFKAVKPGAKLSELTSVSNDVIGEGLVALGVVKDKGEANKYTRHGVSHFLGLDVHDVGTFNAVLQEGMVLTVEPGVYVPKGSPCDEKYWNIGIRIEDDVLVTSDGCRVLSSRAPRSSADVERMMKAKGVGNVPLGK
jgi:Xaa-Pro aminopeptidase